MDFKMKGASSATATPVKEKTMAEKAAHFFTTCQQENSSRLWFPCIGKFIFYFKRDLRGVGTSQKLGAQITLKSKKWGRKTSIFTT